MLDPLYPKEMNNLTPTPTPIPEETTCSFLQALGAVMKGEKIMRQSWRPEITYGCLKDGWLTVFIQNKFSNWIVSEVDMTATDWVILE